MRYTQIRTIAENSKTYFMFSASQNKEAAENELVSFFLFHFYYRSFVCWYRIAFISIQFILIICRYEGNAARRYFVCRHFCIKPL